MTSDENNLAHAFRTGQPGGFDRLYDEYSLRIYRFCLRLCDTTADAEDLTQEVFLAAYRGAAQFDNRSSIATWLYRIAIYRRRSINRVKRPEIVPIDDSTAVSATTNSSSELNRAALDQAIAALPYNQRIAFLLVKEEQLLCREAAQLLRIPESTLKSRVQAAIVSLRRLLATEAVVQDNPRPRPSKPARELTNEV